MIETINVFNDPSLMEPHCTRCNSVIKLDETTRFDVRKKAHVCLCCGEVLR